MRSPDLLLENQICFRVYALEKRIAAAYRPLLAELGLTYPQYLVMLVLWEKEETMVGDICTSLGLDTGTLSPLLKRLEASGLLSRQRNPDDERSVLVRLSPEGSALSRKASQVPKKIAACMFQTEAEYKALRVELDRALSRLGGGRG